jgi:hypothetical protein
MPPRIKLPRVSVLIMPNDKYRSSEVIHGWQGQRRESLAAADGELSDSARGTRRLQSRQTASGLADSPRCDGRGRWRHFASRSFIVSSVDSGIAHALGPVERGKPAAFCFIRCSKILLRGSPATPNRCSAWLGIVVIVFVSIVE